MDLSLPIVFFLAAFIFFLLALLEEREEKENESEQSRSDHLIIIFFVVAFIFFCAYGACMFGIQDSYYSIVSDTLETVRYHEYEPFGWLGFGLAFFVALLMALKVIEIFSEELGKEKEN